MKNGLTLAQNWMQITHKFLKVLDSCHLIFYKNHLNSREYQTTWLNSRDTIRNTYLIEPKVTWKWILMENCLVKSPFVWQVKTLFLKCSTFTMLRVENEDSWTSRRVSLTKKSIFRIRKKITSNGFSKIRNNFSGKKFTIFGQ